MIKTRRTVDEDDTEGQRKRLAEGDDLDLA